MRSRLRCARRFECTVVAEDEVNTFEAKLAEDRLAVDWSCEAKYLGGSSDFTRSKASDHASRQVEDDFLR